ncbi:nucleotidyltransferase domain-containing protein [archaeon]|jgi:predicted nucleotidyltransferase|nr:nucleotidyltransferase domain-containing protein [archaeon]
MEKNKLISYAMEFSSFLVRNCEVDKIVLYGSVARGDFGEGSDIDLFVEADGKNERKIHRLIQDFYKTEVARNSKLKGIENNISVIVGRLGSKEWKDLNRAILNSGIVLYGKYKSNVEKSDSYSLFVFENIKPDKKRIAVFRKLFGFRVGKKSYPGLVNDLKGIKIGKGSILIPLESSMKIKDYFREKKIGFRIYDLWSDVRID